MLGMEHPRKYRGANRGNLGNAENPDSKDTSIYMLASSHSSVLNLLNSSADRSAPNQTPTSNSNKDAFYAIWFGLEFGEHLSAHVKRPGGWLARTALRWLGGEAVLTWEEERRKRGRVRKNNEMSHCVVLADSVSRLFMFFFEGVDDAWHFFVGGQKVCQLRNMYSVQWLSNRRRDWTCFTSWALDGQKNTHKWTTALTIRQNTALLTVPCLEIQGLLQINESTFTQSLRQIIKWELVIHCLLLEIC